jgi:ribosomal protein S18 acetylase RimI-like enzyme
MAILTDFSTEAIDSAAEANFLGLIDDMQYLEGLELYRGTDMIRVVMPGVPHPLTNMVIQAHLGDNPDQAIQAAMRSYTDRGIPFLWQIEPSTQPANLGQMLESHSMQKLGEFPVLVADLNTITAAPRGPEGYEIKRVTDDELLAAFAKPLTEGFQLPDFVADVFIKMVRYDEEYKFQNYVGFLNGEPVAACSTIYAGGVAGFYNGAVVEAARGKGIGTANTLHRIQEAKKRGYRVGFMVSGGNAYNLFTRLGFKDYSPWARYIWMPPHGENSH